MEGAPLTVRGDVGVRGVVTVVATTGKLRVRRARSGWNDLMTASQAGEDPGVGATVSDGTRAHDRERERLVALHRVSTLVAQQRHTDDVLREALQNAVAL